MSPPSSGLLIGVKIVLFQIEIVAGTALNKSSGCRRMARLENQPGWPLADSNQAPRPATRSSFAVDDAFGERADGLFFEPRCMVPSRPISGNSRVQGDFAATGRISFKTDGGPPLRSPARAVKKAASPEAPPDG